MERPFGWAQNDPIAKSLCDFASQLAKSIVILQDRKKSNCRVINLKQKVDTHPLPKTCLNYHSANRLFYMTLYNIHYSVKIEMIYLTLKRNDLT